MRYRTADAFRMALERRLRDRSRETGAALVWLRKEVAFDRLLARLVTVAPDRWVLKGALALKFRWGGAGRTTRDMDLTYRVGEQAATDDLLAAQTVDLHDFFVLAIERQEERRLAEEIDTVRHHVTAELAGRRFEEIIMDVTFSDPLRWEPDRGQGSDLLRFAGIEPVEVPLLPLEQQVAEKVHAYCRLYGQGRRTTRAKDLVDIVLATRRGDLDLGRLADALRVTFAARHDQPSPPADLPRPPGDWGPAYRRLALEVGLDPSPGAGHAEAAALLDPILVRLAGDC